MARTYVRDNRGRFASKGAGATARGGRLRTAAGNKRATRTMRAAAPGAPVLGRTAARTFAGQKAMGRLAKRTPGAVVTPAKRPGLGPRPPKPRNVSRTKQTPAQRTQVNTAYNNKIDSRLKGAGLRGIGSRLRTANANLYAGKPLARSRRTMGWTNHESNQRAGVTYGMPLGAQRSKARPGGPIVRRKRR